MKNYHVDQAFKEWDNGNRILAISHIQEALRKASELAVEKYKERLNPVKK